MSCRDWLWVLLEGASHAVIRFEWIDRSTGTIARIEIGTEENDLGCLLGQAVVDGPRFAIRSLQT